MECSTDSRAGEHAPQLHFLTDIPGHGKGHVGRAAGDLLNGGGRDAGRIGQVIAHGVLGRLLDAGDVHRGGDGLVVEPGKVVHRRLDLDADHRRVAHDH